MKKNNTIDFIQLDDNSATPKYQQLANSITEAVRLGKIEKNAILPSINELSFEFEISRDTAERGYKYLKELGILGSVPGKGFFIKDVKFDQQVRVFLLFNKLSPHKKIIYDSIVTHLEKRASIDLYIYDNDFSFFKKLLHSKLGGYTHYVIIPHFLEGGDNAHEVINKVDKDKLILLDKLIPHITGEFSAVYENFEKDIYNALEQALPALSKYHTLKLIFPAYTYFPKEIVIGFSKFCQQYAFNYQVVHDIKAEVISEGEAYINLMEDDLVSLIEKILANNLTVGKNVGVISYNETPVKKIILNGITTMSTDFQLMGQRVAEIILTGSQEHIQIPFQLTSRPSL
jgi:DNA-binding transcriptional regulator YhcF (GntR family)